jgi:hypothetical protein
MSERVAYGDLNNVTTAQLRFPSPNQHEKFYGR